jgi:UDP-N-acetylmuramoylalanine--D-glutamate ligase
VTERALVVGLGRSGRAAALLLARRGVQVTAVDERVTGDDELTTAGVVFGNFNAPPRDFDLLVKSPGVPGTAVPIMVAWNLGVRVISEIELAASCLPNPLLAITGTNGKTTTTELTAHLLNAGGIPAIACGNQGTALASLVDEVPPATWLVVECSSFQLEDVDSFHPRGAVLLNVAPDHLDRHGTLEDYRGAKMRIFERQGSADLSILPRNIAPPTNIAARYIDDRQGEVGAVAWADGGLHLQGHGLICAWDSVPLAAHAGLAAADIATGLASFPGVPHRLELVAEINGVRYINDSKATNPEAAMAALDAEPAGVHLILGGQAKGTPFGPLAGVARGPVVRAYVIGQAADEIGEAFRGEGIEVEDAGTLAAAVASANAAARPGEVVLLAPACASFDQFSGYEDRGQRFRELVAQRR